MSLFQSFILGMVQGLAEFLPISSSGHLVIVPWMFGWPDPGLAYDVFLHGGTLLAIGIYFFSDLRKVLFAGIQSVFERRIGFIEDRRLAWKIVLGTAPAAIAGFLLHDALEEYFRSPLMIAVMLAGVGFIIYWVDGHYTALKNQEDMSFKDSLLIGCAQVFALIPGVSRSGSTMGMARVLGVSRADAAKFSFLLCFPITLAAFIFEGKKLFFETNAIAIPWPQLWIGFASSFFFGIISIHFLLQYLRRADFKIFTWYRVIVAGIVLLVSVFFHP